MIHDKIRRATETWSEIEWRCFIWHYYRYIEKVDREIGNLLNALEISPYKDNTLILFTADHGESLANHRMFQKFTTYEESVRVPFMVSSFSDQFMIQKGTRDHENIVSGLDLFRTVCGFAGLEPPESIHGKNLRPLVEGTVNGGVC